MVESSKILIFVWLGSTMYSQYRLHTGNCCHVKSNYILPYRMLYKKLCGLRFVRADLWAVSWLFMKWLMNPIWHCIELLWQHGYHKWSQALLAIRSSWNIASTSLLTCIFFCAMYCIVTTVKHPSLYTLHTQKLNQRTSYLVDLVQPRMATPFTKEERSGALPVCLLFHSSEILENVHIRILWLQQDHNRLQVAGLAMNIVITWQQHINSLLVPWTLSDL